MASSGHPIDPYQSVVDYEREERRSTPVNPADEPDSDYLDHDGYPIDSHDIDYKE